MMQSVGTYPPVAEVVLVLDVSVVGEEEVDSCNQMVTRCASKALFDDQKLLLFDRTF